MIRPIHPGLSPNSEAQDFLLALLRLVTPWSYIQGEETATLCQWFEKKYEGKAYAYTSGRGALAAALTSMGVGKGDSVLIAGFTCVAVVDGVLATGAKPVFVDLQKDFTMNVANAKKKCDKKTKAIIVQHTFGIASGTKEMIAFAKSKNIFLIEDVAHGIGLAKDGKLIGTFGDAAIFSLGRDKAFSCVSGGILVLRNKNFFSTADAFYQKQSFAEYGWTFQQLFHMVSFFALILPLYNVVLGKLFLVLFQKIRLLTKPIDTDELTHFSKYTQKLPAALAAVALLQLRRMEQFNTIRRSYVQLYQAKLAKFFPDIIQEDASLLRFPLLIANPLDLKRFARKQQVYLGDWYSNLIDPKGTDIARYGYDETSCPVAVSLARHIVNLPTYPTLSRKDAEKVVTICIDYATRTTDRR